MTQSNALMPWARKTLRMVSSDNPLMHAPNEVAKEPYAILPLAEARASALLLINKIFEHQGLTRSRKGYGARLSKADYPAVWTWLYPNETQPELKLGRLLYWLQPTPRGIDASDLRRWLQDIKWRNTTVVRSVASDVWLVAALTEPPAEFMQMNRRTVLAKPVQRRFTGSRPTNPVLAGQPPVLSVTTQKPPIVDGPQDPLVASDPWRRLCSPVADRPFPSRRPRHLPPSWNNGSIDKKSSLPNSRRQYPAWKSARMRFRRMSLKCISRSRSDNNRISCCLPCANSACPYDAVCGQYVVDTSTDTHDRHRCSGCVADARDLNR